LIMREPATTHIVSLSQIRRWCAGVAVSPDEVLKRKRVKDLIGASFRRQGCRTASLLFNSTVSRPIYRGVKERLTSRAAQGD
jgi:hypothetical protein